MTSPNLPTSEILAPCRLTVKDFKQERHGVAHLKVSGKGGNTRYAPLHPAAGGLIPEYLEAAGHGADDGGALFQPVHNSRVAGSAKAITPDGIYKIVRAYSAALGVTNPHTSCHIFVWRIAGFRGNLVP
jgi:integrase